MTNTILTPEQRTVLANNPANCLGEHLQAHPYGIAIESAVLAELVQRAGVAPNIRECIAGRTIVGYPPEAIAQLQAKIEALSAEVERTEKRLHEVATLCATAEQERDQLRSQLEAQGEAAQDLIDATEALMAWHVKNVKVWNHPTWDTADMRVKQLRALLPTQPKGEKA